MGLFTVSLFGLVVIRLHPGPIRDTIGQIAFMPSMLLSHLFYSNSSPTSTPTSWAYVFDISGILFYSVIWYVLLSLTAVLKGKH